MDAQPKRDAGGGAAARAALESLRKRAKPSTQLAGAAAPRPTPPPPGGGGGAPPPRGAAPPRGGFDLAAWAGENTAPEALAWLRGHLERARRPQAYPGGREYTFLGDPMSKVEGGVAGGRR
jgi:hypothetical protein